jgi:hypothetical protein
MVHTAIKHNRLKTPNWQSRQTATLTRETVTATGLSYFGARYLDPKTSRWTSADPALGEYIPGAPINDEVKKRNGNLPGMGGVFNTVNLHVYHYAGNNPVKYVDPDGRLVTPSWLRGFVSQWLAKPDPQGGRSISTNAPQRAGGYSISFETFTSNNAVCNIDSLLFSFRNTEGQDIQLWFWKGNYNLVNDEIWDNLGIFSFDWHIGGEIGTYIGTPERAAAIDNAVVSMSYSLYQKGDGIPFLTRSNNGEYWLNGFSEGQASNTGDIVMRGSITFKNSSDAKAFMNSNRRGREFPSNNNNPNFYATRRGATVDFIFE